MKNLSLGLILLFFLGCEVTSCSKKKQEPPNKIENIVEDFETPKNETQDFTQEESPPDLPILISKQVSAFRSGVTSNFDLEFKFFEPETHQVSVKEAPEWITFDPAKVAISGTPSGSAKQKVILSIQGTNSTKSDTVTLTIQDDPLTKESWHYSNSGQSSFSENTATAGFDLNLNSTMANGNFGQGIRVAISDTAAESSHEDLTDNHNAQLSKDYNKPSPYFGTPPTSSDAHGTSVAGIIAATGWNQIGIRGIAPEAQFSTLNFLDSDQTDEMQLDQISGPYDIFNQSWGLNVTRVNTLDLDYRALLKSNVKNLRQGKGPIYVRAVGNNFSVCKEFLCSENSSTDPFNTTPYTINVAGINASGERASYSTTGSAIWVSAPSGEFGEDNPAIITTDITGCDKGYAKSDAEKNDFEKGQETNTNCNYTSTFNGTSAAAPMVSGAVALILAANPNLGWRDVKYILAKSSSRIDSEFSAVEIPDLSINFADPWKVNGSGFSFHNWYGFGILDIDAAVSMAKSYSQHLPGIVETTDWANGVWKYDSGVLSQSIPDKSDLGTSHTLTVSETSKIEAIMVQLDIEHDYPNELMVTLTAPSGTVSTVLNTFNSFISDPNLTGWIALSNTFYRESPAGDWKLTVYDTLADDTGTLKNWKLNIISDAN